MELVTKCNILLPVPLGIVHLTITFVLLTTYFAPSVPLQFYKGD
jgi:hypothetical protein